MTHFSWTSTTPCPICGKWIRQIEADESEICAACGFLVIPPPPKLPDSAGNGSGLDAISPDIPEVTNEDLRSTRGTTGGQKEKGE